MWEDGSGSACEIGAGSMYEFLKHALWLMCYLQESVSSLILHKQG